MENAQLKVVGEKVRSPVNINSASTSSSLVRVSSLAHFLSDRICYKEFLWSYIWNNEIEPWWVKTQMKPENVTCRWIRDLYDANNLVVIINKASIEIPPDATKEQLIEVSTLINWYIDHYLFLFVVGTGKLESTPRQTKNISISDLDCIEFLLKVHF